MKKYICLLLCLLTLFLYGCDNTTFIEPALTINSLLEETELSELELSENQHAIKLYGNLPPFLHIIRDYGSIDAYEESLRAEQKSMEDNSEIVVWNSDGDSNSIVYPQNESGNYNFFCDPNYESNLIFVINDPDVVVGRHITFEVSGIRRSYNIDRILFLKCEDKTKNYFEYIIYIETNRGTYVYFRQSLKEDLSWIIPLDIVKEKCNDWPCELYPGQQTDSFYTVFGDKYMMQDRSIDLYM